MKKLFFIFTLVFVCPFLWKGANACSQVAYAPDLMRDDPIVAALDSLYKLDLFEMGYAKAKGKMFFGICKEQRFITAAEKNKIVEAILSTHIDTFIIIARVRCINSQR